MTLFLEGIPSLDDEGLSAFLAHANELLDISLIGFDLGTDTIESSYPYHDIFQLFFLFLYSNNFVGMNIDLLLFVFLFFYFILS